MRRFLTALLLALACAVPAQATVHRLMAYIPPPAPFPATQTVNFGVKTLVGFGGSPVAYASPQLLGLSRWLGITSQVDASSASVSIFCIDDRNMLVPKSASGSTCAPHTGTGAYGGAWSTPANGPYTVTVAEYRDAALTQPTGSQTVVTVPIISNAAHAREMTSATAVWGSCAINCEVINPDGGTGSFNAETNQMSALVKTGAPVCLGDTIYLRDAGNSTVNPTKFNPGQAQYDIRPKALASFCGSGRITYISETIDGATDTFGLAELQHGFRFGGGIRFNVNDVGAGVALPIDFDDVYCYEDRNAVVTTANACFTYNNNTAGTGGVGLYASRCEITTAVTAEQFCMNSYGSLTVQNSRFIYTGITIRAQLGTLISTGNVGQNLREDMHSIGCSPNSVVTDNFMFNPSPKAGVHQDFEQSVGCGAPWVFGEVARNILVLNDTAALAGVNDAPQDIFNANPIVGLQATASNANIHNNIGYSLTTNAITYSYWNNGTINLNTMLTMANPGTSPVTNPFKAQISLQAGQGVCCDITANNNVANGGAFTGQPGVIIDANRVTVPWTGVGVTDAARYLTDFPALVTGPGPMGVTNRAAAILQFAPAYRTGDAYNIDGSYSGALTPPDSAGHPCWNVLGLTTFTNASTCVAQGLTAAT